MSLYKAQFALCIVLTLAVQIRPDLDAEETKSADEFFEYFLNYNHGDIIILKDVEEIYQAVADGRDGLNSKLPRTFNENMFRKLLETLIRIVQQFPNAVDSDSRLSINQWRTTLYPENRDIVKTELDRTMCPRSDGQEITLTDIVLTYIFDLMTDDAEIEEVSKTSFAYHYNHYLEVPKEVVDATFEKIAEGKASFDFETFLKWGRPKAFAEIMILKS